jgi:hypothetical protein
VLPTIVVIVLVIGVVLSVRLFMQRAAKQRAAHDARLRMMAQATMAALKKKHGATAAPSGRDAAESSGTPIREERECPYCAELILKKARVCKHCGRDVEAMV